MGERQRRLNTVAHARVYPGRMAEAILVVDDDAPIRRMLDRALRAVWSHAPQRVWLHTDTYDHPAAQSVYSRAGFKPYEQRMETFPD